MLWWEFSLHLPCLPADLSVLQEWLPSLGLDDIVPYSALIGFPVSTDFPVAFHLDNVLSHPHIAFHLYNVSTLPGLKPESCRCPEKYYSMALSTVSTLWFLSSLWPWLLFKHKSCVSNLLGISAQRPWRVKEIISNLVFSSYFLSLHSPWFR